MSKCKFVTIGEDEQRCVTHNDLSVYCAQRILQAANITLHSELSAVKAENQRMRVALEELRTTGCGMVHPDTSCCLVEAGIESIAEDALTPPKPSEKPCQCDCHFDYTDCVGPCCKKPPAREGDDG